MLELAKEINTAMMTETSQLVQIWMNWMVFIFFLSIIFIFHKTNAKYILATIILTLVSAAAIFSFTKNVHHFAFPHLVLWTPLAYYLYKFEFKSPHFKAKSIYGIYLILLLLTIMTSLIFDVKDTILIILEMK